MNDQGSSPTDESSLHAEVEDRFGVLPNFFRLAPETPEVTENLWGFAKFGYLDNPLPSLFKERLFVYLSQFCEVRYCISRHVGFLVGLGRPAGDRQTPPETFEQAARLIRRPFPRGDALTPHIAFCESCESPLAELPESESFAEEAIFACAGHLFLQTAEAPRCLEVLRRALGSVKFQHLLVLITFVRTAHFWTKVHPELEQEDDITNLLKVQEGLAECVLRNEEERDSETVQILLDELVELRKEREQAELLRVTLASIGDAVIVTDSAGQITTLNTVAEELTGWTSVKAHGKSLDAVLRIVDEESRLPTNSPVALALRENRIVRLANHSVLVALDGTEHSIDISAAPICDANENVNGSVLIFRDISKRRQAERESEEARCYAECIIDTMPGSLVVLNGNLQVLSANQSFYETFRVTPEETERCRLYDLGNGQWDIPRLRLLLEEILPQNSTVEEYEVDQNFPDLGHRTMLLNARKLPRSGNHADLVLLAIEDATERKRSEESLRRLASVVETTNDAIISKSLDGIIQTWNAAAEQIFGYTAAEAVGRHISMLIPEERGDEEDRIVSQLRSGKRVEHFDTVRRRSDGKHIQVSLTISPIRNAAGEVIGASKIARDITERKRAEEALVRHAETFTRLVDQSPFGIYIVDSEFRIVRVSEGAVPAFSNVEPLVGRDFAEAMHILWPEPFASEAVAIFRHTLATGEPYRSPGLTERRRDTDYTESYEWQVHRVTLPDGQYGAVCYFFDTTKLREAERALRESNTKAQQANRAKSEFLANMSHEIRTPMAAIIGHADVLLAHLKDADNRGCVNTIKRNGTHLLDIINDILDLSRIEAGKLEVACEPCRLVEILADIWSLMHVRVERKPLELHVIVEGVLPETIQTDPKRLKQILINLLGNAIKFTESGQVTLRVTHIHDDDESAIRFAVEDTGIGISEEHLEHLFESFSQADASVTRNFGGSGLGLSISKRLATMLNGQLTVESTEGVGSTFTLELPTGALDGVPIAEITIDQIVPEPETPTISARLSCKILVVDDRRDVRHVAQHFLEEAGASVVTAIDGLKGIDAVRRAEERGENFDLIVMDMQMPKMDGYTATSELRSSGCDLPIVALTADAMSGDRERCLNVGCDDYLSKPIDAAILIEKVGRLTQDISAQDLLAERARRMSSLLERSDGGEKNTP